MIWKQHIPVTKNLCLRPFNAHTFLYWLVLDIGVSPPLELLLTPEEDELELKALLPEESAATSGEDEEEGSCWVVYLQ